MTRFSLGNKERRKSGQFVLLVIDERHWSAEVSHTIHSQSWEFRCGHLTRKSNDAGLVGKGGTWSTEIARVLKIVEIGPGLSVIAS